MLDELEVRKRVRSLDMMIRALSQEILRQAWFSRRGEADRELLKEMEEALGQLRWARGFGKMVLTAIGSNGQRPESLGDAGPATPLAHLVSPQAQIAQRR